MNILRAFERLTEAPCGKKNTENSDGQNGAPPTAETEPENLNAGESQSLTESLLSRHERSVYRIKNNKR